ncbi:MAG TPA: hypothetical protein VL326_37950 [Kofleriaceae bacterium]|nr:hypothetical protein [Kofleriaceae bacterium]
MWARVHKVDKIKPLPLGGAIVVLEDERNASHMQRVPSLSTLIAIARVLAAKRLLAIKFDGKGEVRYATNALVPSFLSEAIARAGAAVTERDGEKIKMPAAPSGVAAIIDVAFSELAHHARGAVGVLDIGAALKQIEARRRASPLDRDKQPELYWPAVFELAALAGEQSRARGGRWIETTELPVPFALKFPEGQLAKPTEVAQKIVEGKDELDASMADVEPPLPS